MDRRASSAASQAYEEAQRIDAAVSEAITALNGLLPGQQLTDRVIYSPKFSVCGTRSISNEKKLKVFFNRHSSSYRHPDPPSPFVADTPQLDN
jgi:hypothetical protein